MNEHHTTRPAWRIDDILSRTDLAALLDQLAEPASHNLHGRRWHCPVPGHDDRHASVTIHTDHRGHERWRCWSGDDTHRGDAIDLITITQHRTRVAAIDWLATRAGMTPDQPLPPLRRKPPSRPRVVPLSPRVARYVESCERMLWTTQPGRAVQQWLHGRGLSEQVLRANHVGADPGVDQWWPGRNGLPHGNSLAATFPALDPTGHVTYVQARYLQPGEHGDKYDNPAGSLGTNPRLAWTRTPHVERDDITLICEGIPDALTAADNGYQAVAILGAQAPDRNVATRLAENLPGQHLVAVIDADTAGRAWGNRLAELCQTVGTSIQILSPPYGADLNTWAQLDPSWSSALPTPVLPLPDRIEPCPAIAADPPEL